MFSQEQYRDYLLKFAFWGAILAVLLAFIYFLLGPLTPFIIAFVVAGSLQPVMRRILAKKSINTGILATVLTVLCYVLIVGILLLLVIGIFSVIINWASGLPHMFSQTISPWVEKSIDDVLAFVYRLDPGMGKFVDDMLPDALASAGTAIMEFSVSLVAWASSVGTKLPGAMLTVIICIIATAFAAKDFDKIGASVLAVFPPRAQDMLRQMKFAVVNIVGKYLRSYTLILFITFMEIWIGLELIGFENSVAIAAIIAIFDFLPIVGSGMVLLPWTIFTFIQGELMRGIGLLVLYLVVVIARQVIEPRIVSKRVGLHPLSTLMLMWLGLKLFGGVGMLALPVCTLILKDLHESGLLNNISIAEPETNCAKDSDGRTGPELSEEEELS